MTDIRMMVAKTPDTLRGKRDRLIILLGVASAMRRSNLCSLNVEDVREVEGRGLILVMARSKTDQSGVGYEVGIPKGSHIETDPVAAYQEWVEAAGITTGAVFRAVTKGKVMERRLSDREISRCVKHYVKKIGLDPARFGAHSLRVSFCTISSQNGATLAAVMDQANHRSFASAKRYQRRANLLGADNAARFLGL